MRSNQLFWVAGIIDGEGCLTISKSSRGYTPKVYVGMTHEFTIRLLYQIFNVGTVHIEVSTNEKHKTIYSWSVYGKDAIIIIESIRMHLICKWEQAELLAEFGKDCMSAAPRNRYNIVPKDVKQKMDIIHEELLTLNKKGATKTNIQNYSLYQTKDQMYAWAAGIIDGEGCIRIVRQKKYYYPLLSITNTNVNMLRTIREIFGCGRIEKSRSSTERWSECYVFKIECDRMINIIKKVYPYIVTKKDQIQLILEFAEKCRGKWNKMPDEIKILTEVMFEEMKQLNRKGPEK